MKVKLVEKRNPMKPMLAKKVYGHPCMDVKVTMDVIARQVAGRSSLSVGDVKNVLTNFLEEIPTFLLLNHAVELADFGNLRISFGSKGAATAEEFSVKMMKEPKIIFTPNIKMKKRIKDEITFEIDRPEKKEEVEPAE